jgi:hypothetical protein
MTTTTFNPSITVNRIHRFPVSSFFAKFITWSKSQEENRLLWVGISLTLHGCVLAPVTIFAVMLAGNSMFLFMLPIITMGATLVTNLAAMPTKITIPVFLLSILIDVVVLLTCALSGFGQINIF